MTKDLENLYKAISQSMGRSNPKNDEEAQKLIDEMIREYNSKLKTGRKSKKSREEESDDYLDMAQNATDIDSANRYLDKALELNPDNFDASIAKIGLRTDEFDKLKDLDILLNKEEEKLRSEGFFQDTGYFWGMFETRPYMRGLALKCEILESLCRITEVIQVAETMIKLCKNDNLGVRYHLMSYYAIQENLKKALQLHKKYKNEDSLGFFLPLAVCYFRLGMYDDCKATLQKAEKANKYFIRMLKMKNILDTEPEDFYSPGKESEVLMAVAENRELLYSTLPFLRFLRICFPDTKSTTFDQNGSKNSETTY